MTEPTLSLQSSVRQSGSDADTCGVVIEPWAQPIQLHTRPSTDSQISKDGPTVTAGCPGRQPLRQVAAARDMECNGTTDTSADKEEQRASAAPMQATLASTSSMSPISAMPAQSLVMGSSRPRHFDMSAPQDQQDGNAPASKRAHLLGSLTMHAEQPSERSMGHLWESATRF
ncbi:hypothetical protein WJX84_009970 [Apatococcus fuscideae]|uniref:Uncharacterized protein n=1 Tax=Apatococcus fuscideae TaxID=2026836 RepID=A0AAW1T460_9CHLO